jgi:hypothetical protein
MEVDIVRLIYTYNEALALPFMNKQESKPRNSVEFRNLVLYDVYEWT